MVFNFEKEKLIRELKRVKPKPKKVLIQLPEGIKQNSFDLLKIFQDLKIEAVFSGETCWGGCSVGVEEAKGVGADTIVHFGHSEFMKVKFPVKYIEVKDELNLEPILQKSLEKLKNFKKIGLSCSVQHIQDLDKIVKFYKDNNKQVILSEKLGKVNYPGQILGCQYSGLKAIQKKVEIFVILGNEFHATGALMTLEKPVILLDVYNDKIQDFPGLKEKIIKQRAIAIEKFKQAKKIGIIVELKPGQKFGSEKQLIEKLKKIKKDFIVISMNELTNEKLRNFYDVECFIELACPRIALDDVEQFEKPLLTFKEALVGLGEKSWEEFLKEGIL
jgi:2-(3-amino-3-carboxypropyl)histidine synthase